jgi:hypothetical protein
LSGRSEIGNRDKCKSKIFGYFSSSGSIMKINAMQQGNYFDLIHALLIMMKVIVLSHPGLYIPRVGLEFSFEPTRPVECDLASIQYQHDPSVENNAGRDLIHERKLFAE